MKILLSLLFLSTNLTFAADEISRCNYFKYCETGSGTASKSLPSSGTSAGFNPSTISAVKGFGLETLLQANNSVGFNLVSGTGKVGGALISPTLENSFFGNRSLEIDEEFLHRFEDKKRYKNKKINLALGANLVRNEAFSFDLGVAVRRNPDVKKINPGAGFSAKVWFLNFGGYIYKDDVKINLGSYFNPYTGTPYAIQYGSSTYQETYTVKTFSVGTKIKNVAFDYGRIMTKYNFYPTDTVINIYSMAISNNKFMLNLAYRREESPNLKESEGVLVYDRIKNDMYYGLQYIINSHLVLGVGYNTFLLDEWSGTVTIYI